MIHQDWIISLSTYIYIYVCVCMYVYNCFFKVAHTFYLRDLENVNPYSLSNILAQIENSLLSLINMISMSQVF